MSVPQKPSGEKRLSELLQSWKLEGPLPPRFGQGVWERIAKRQNRPGLVYGCLGRLNLWWRRPGWIVTYATALLLAGFAFGWWRAHQADEKMNQHMARRYVQLVAPYGTWVSSPP